MTNKDLDILKNKKAEQEFFDMAAREIDKELDQVFIEAQNLPDPDPEILQRIQKNLNAEMYKQTVAWYIKKWASGIGKVAACIVFVSGVIFTGAYLHVEATRNQVNNFFLELFDEYAVIHHGEDDRESGVTMPASWSGPFSVGWVPQRFTDVFAQDMTYSWALYYDDLNSDNDLAIYVWDPDIAPTINTEGENKISEQENKMTEYYHNPSRNTYSVVSVQNGYMIYVKNANTQEEAEEILKNISF